MSKQNREKIIDSPHFPYILIRDFLLTNILGNDTTEILYWSGKELARQFPLLENQDIQMSFAHCGFGTLTLIKEDKKKLIYQLSGDLVDARLLNENPSFHLEAGFLAEQTTRTTDSVCEAHVDLSEKKEVTITLVFD